MENPRNVFGNEYIRGQCVEWRGSNEAPMLKQTGSSWDSPNFANNISGFSALPGGFRNGYESQFYEVGEAAYFWTSTAYNDEYNWMRHLLHDSNTIFRSSEYWIKRNGLSVRCIEDN